MRARGALILMPLLVVAVLLGVLLGLDNSTPVALTFLDWSSPELPLFAWALLSLLLGVIFGLLAGLPARLRQRLTIRRLQRQLER